MATTTARQRGVEVHGGDPTPSWRCPTTPSSRREAKPPPPEEEIDCRGTAYVEDGYMSIAWNDRVLDEPDWDHVERDSEAVV